MTGKEKTIIYIWLERKESIYMTGKMCFDHQNMLAAKWSPNSIKT
jgi:hypothetical protein